MKYVYVMGYIFWVVCFIMYSINGIVIINNKDDLLMFEIEYQKGKDLVLLNKFGKSKSSYTILHNSFLVVFKRPFYKYGITIVNDARYPVTLSIEKNEGEKAKKVFFQPGEVKEFKNGVLTILKV